MWYFVSNRSIRACSWGVSCNFFQTNWSRKALRCSSSSAGSKFLSSWSHRMFSKIVVWSSWASWVLARLRRRRTVFFDWWIGSLEKLIDDVDGLVWVQRDKGELFKRRDSYCCERFEFGENCSVADGECVGLLVQDFDCCSYVLELVHWRGNDDVLFLGESRSRISDSKWNFDFNCCVGWHEELQGFHFNWSTSKFAVVWL